ncbi:WXG100 family type VII secretion target [Actinoplanes sp. NPDC051470]|uniref:WXG100 family type VII secretion target n=1 Tax=unclassified Actinoplanes TaxID=2626549 RepID=UPI00343E8C19
MVNLQMNPGAVDTVVDNLQRSNGTIRDQLSAIHDFANQHRDTWHGPSREAYDKAQLLWGNSAQNMNNALGVAVTKLAEMKAAIMRGEARSASGWGDVSAGLPR